MVEDDHTANVDGFFAVVVVVLTVVVVVHDPGLWVTEPTLKNKMLRLGLSYQVLQLLLFLRVYIPMPNNWDVLCTCIEAESIKIKIKITRMTWNGVILFFFFFFFLSKEINT